MFSRIYRRPIKGQGGDVPVDDRTNVMPASSVGGLTFIDCVSSSFPGRSSMKLSLDEALAASIERRRTKAARVTSIPLGGE